MKTCHRSLIPEESPAIKRPNCVCESIIEVAAAARMADRINPQTVTTMVRSI
jgi:hypothetical protein